MSSAGHPLSLAQLLDYWLDELPEAEVEPLEEHLFECTECAERLEDVRATAEAIVGLVRSGGLAANVTTALANRMARDRLNLRPYVLSPGEVVLCTVGPHDDFLMGTFMIPAGDHHRIDLTMQDGDGNEVMRVDDVAFDPVRGQVITLIPARPTQDEASGRSHYVLLTEGNRELARYTLDHTAMREA